MLTILHGNDTAQSRKSFLEEKQKYPDAITLSAEKINLTDLTQLFDGGGLFGETKYLFIEQFITKRKKNTDFKDLVAYLEKNAPDHTIFLWEEKELDRGSLMVFPKAITKPFKLPQTLFQLLDSIHPGNGKLLMQLFHQTIETAETEMVFFMLVRQLRILLALTTPSVATEDLIDELKRMQPWQQTKLQKQASAFTPEELLTLYHALFRIEVAQKTGGLSSPLVSTIDFFLLEV
jgi:DNA polymerase III delta subunit